MTVLRNWVKQFDGEIPDKEMARLEGAAWIIGYLTGEHTSAVAARVLAPATISLEEYAGMAEPVQDETSPLGVWGSRATGAVGDVLRLPVDLHEVAETDPLPEVDGSALSTRSEELQAQEAPEMQPVPADLLAEIQAEIARGE